MAVLIETRPIKSISDSEGIYLNSYYNASGGELPTEYDLSNNLFPLNQRDTAFNVVGITNSGGRCLMEVIGGDYTSIEADDKFNDGAWVSIVADTQTFVGQVVSFQGSPNILLSIPYDTFFASASSISFNWYAKDYKILVNVYVGLNPSHPSYSEQPNRFIAQKNVSAFFYDSGANKNLDSFDITGLIKNEITQSFRDITETELNLNQYTQFRIEYAEVYKLINPATGDNELYDGANYERDWELGQPAFTADDFNCSSAQLNNEEFSTDLTGWTNTVIGGGAIDWVWNSGSASATLGTSGTGAGAQYLYQDYAYQVNARYTIEAEVNGALDCRFQVWLESSGTSEKLLLHEQIIPATGSTVVQFDFQAVQIGRGEDPDRISFRAINSDSSGVNNVRVEYFQQSQANEGCEPYLSGVYSVRQFRSTYGGSMGDYEGTFDVDGKFLTNNTNLIVKEGDVNPEISIISNYQASVNRATGVRVSVTYSDGNTEVYYSNSSDSGEGVYRVSLNEIKSAIESYISLNTVRVATGSIEGVVGSASILSDWIEGTFESATGAVLINPDSIGGASISNYDTSHPRTGTGSGSIANPFSGLGGGFRSPNLILFEAGQTYLLSAYVLIGQDDEIASQRWVDDPNQDTFISLALIDSGGSTLITTDATYQQLSGNLTEYTLITATYTPASDISAYVGYYKGGTDETVGAQKVYIDDYLVESDEQVITEAVNFVYTDSNINCNTYSLKWLNSLGGVDFHSFEGRSSHNIDITESNRYKKQVFGNWDAQFIGGEGIGFEQYVKFNRVQTLRTKVINQDLKRFLSEIKTSINVKMYFPELDDYVTVLVDKDSFNVFNDSQNTYKFEFDVIFPDSYVQTA